MPIIQKPNQDLTCPSSKLYQYIISNNYRSLNFHFIQGIKKKFDVLRSKVKPKLTNLDRSFWIAFKQSCIKWKDLLVIVKPETIISWQKQKAR
jgi:hypothetical protein